jgi:paraquat-inducible protein A
MSDVMTFPSESAAARGLACCHICYKLAPEALHECPRCHAALHLRTKNSLDRTLALLLTSMILYIPANVLPIMTTTTLGSETESTIIGGVLLLVEMGSYPVAAVIFIASVMVPLGKFIALLLLYWSVSRRQKTSHHQRTVLYRATEFIGRWSMVDVFVVTVLVALVSLGSLMRITPGVASIAFGGVVILTMLAAESFDPRLIWDQLADRDD